MKKETDMPKMKLSPDELSRLKQCNPAQAEKYMKILPYRTVMSFFATYASDDQLHDVITELDTLNRRKELRFLAKRIRKIRRPFRDETLDKHRDKQKNLNI